MDFVFFVLWNMQRKNGGYQNKLKKKEKNRSANADNQSSATERDISE